MKLPCLVFIKDRNAIIDSGNPAKTELFNLSQVSDAFLSGVLAAEKKYMGRDFETEEEYFRRKYNIDL